MADFNEDKRKQEKTKGDGVNEDSMCCRIVVRGIFKRVSFWLTISIALSSLHIISAK